MDTPFDPGGAAAPDSGLFGLDTSWEDARAIVIGVPFDATTSYRAGAAAAPAAIHAASHQVELLDLEFGEPWRAGIHMEPIDERVAAWSAEARALAEPILERGGRLDGDAELERGLARVDELGGRLDAWLDERVARVLAAGKLPFVVGGDHSVPLGAWRAVSRTTESFGLLHFDAHCDLRRAYEGFRWSHASIVFNALEALDPLTRVVQVGIRDACEEELELARASEGRVDVVLDHAWAAARLAHRDLEAFARERVERLPRDVWITLDVDGLEHALCPGTGTPVPGGLDWHELALWLRVLRDSGRNVLGADLVEVAPGWVPPGGDSWDAVVGARLLHRLIATALG